MRTPRTRKLLSGALALIVLACLWFCFAPSLIGGSTSYVVTEGISMEPRFHSGDLALVRNQSSYRVGEIVAYHSRVLHTVVLHRIVGRVGHRYVLKGDNNNFLDFEHPAQSQLIGALWLHLPGWGARLRSLRSPALIGGLIALGTILLAGAAFAQKRRRRGRQRRAEGSPGRRSGMLPEFQAGYVLAVVGTALAALLPFLVLAVAAFTRPSTALLGVTVPYRQSGALSYSADATPGPAYPGNRAVTGDPLFTHVLSAVRFRYRYSFHAAAAHSLAGRAALSARIASTSGWQTSIALGSASYFRGNHALVSGTLDIATLAALLHRVETTTAVSGSYTLTLVPHVSVGGSLGALPVHTTFSSNIPFSLNRLEMRPVLPTAGSGGAKPAANPFARSAGGSAKGRRYQPAMLSLKIARVSVTDARRIALAAIVLIALALIAALAFARPRSRSEAAEIRARYGSAIVPVARVWQQPGVAVIDVEDIESLARIAGHYERSILYELTEYGEVFWVSDESGQFRYVADPAEEEILEYYAAADPLAEEAYAEPGYGEQEEIVASALEPTTANQFAPDHPAGNSWTGAEVLASRHAPV